MDLVGEMLDSDDLEVEFDFTNLMRGDAASRSSYYQSGIQNGWLTRNEARIAEKLNPLDGLDEPLRPLNMVEEGAAVNPVQEMNTPADAAAARFRAVLASSAERWARRIARAGRVEDKDIALIAEALAVSLDRAAEWAHTISANPIDEAELTRSLIAMGETT